LSGDFISVELAQDIQRIFPKAQLIALGGATEASIWSNYFVVEQLLKHWSSIPYGRALTNQQLYVLSPLLEPCPCLVAGQLYIGGLGVGKGYYHKPELTAAQFIEHVRFGRIYQTGDIAKINRQGQVIILGRYDEQIKIRGFRVEIKEIELMLLQSGLITQAKVLAIGDSHEKRLIAFLVGGHHQKESALLAYLKQHLPTYMIPSALVYVEAMPLTQNGKIDSQVLISQMDFLPEATIEESTHDDEINVIKNIFRKILDIKSPIQETASFFSLGGDSISASYVIFELNHQLQQQLRVEDLFNYPTAKALKALIQPTKHDMSLSLPTPKALGLSHAPLSPSQLRLMFIEHQAAQPGATYNMTLFYRFKGALNTALFIEACHTVLSQQPILNTHIQENEEGCFEQFTHVPEALNHQSHDISNVTLDEHAKDTLAKQMLVNASKIPFHLEKHPKYQLIVIRTNHETVYCLVMLHHLVADGESIKLLFAAIEQAYEVGVQSKNKPAYDYFDYITWFEAFINTQAYVKQATYWREKMNECAAFQKQYPSTLLSQAKRVSVSGKRMVVTIEKSCYQTSKDRSSFIELLTLFKWALHHLFQNHVSIIGTTVAARPRGFEESIGFFANTLPIITLIQEDESFTSLHQKVRQAMIELLDNQLLPFDEVVHLAREAGVIETVTHQPLFHIAFVYLQELYLLNNQPTLHVERLYLDNETSKFDLTLYVHEAPNHLRFEFEYDLNIFNQAIMTQLIDLIQKNIGILQPP
jgi:NRPS condensation-like uncharacterized protein/acyl carrier protein